MESLDEDVKAVDLREAHDEMSATLDATNRLLKVGALFLEDGNLGPVLGEMVDAAIAISRADFGNIQVFDRESGDLRIAAHRGLPPWWIEYWDAARAGQGACGSALETRQRVIVVDVELDPIFVGTPSLDIQRRAGVRAVQSTPLLSRAGDPVGILSTHYRTPGAPDTRVLRLLDLLARQAADILERARAERELKANEERFRALAEASSAVLYRMSPDWREMRELVSRGFLAPTAAAAAATSPPWLERYIPPEDRAEVMAVIDRAIRTRSVFELEHRVVRADGTLGWVWSRAVPVTDGLGEIVEWFGAANDVTDRKRAELDLADANRRLREADRRKNEFLAVLSHELRNPLAPIRTSFDLLDQLEPGSSQDRRARDVIHRQLDHLTRLVDDLLDVTRITSGKIALQRELLDLAELTRRTVEDHRDAFVRAGVELAYVAAPTPVRVNGDRTRLAQVTGNLLHNAAKFTPRGGTTTVTVEGDSAHARIRVTDSGRGISPELLPHLFEPFIQADDTLDRRLGGLGLGLAVAKGLIELHGGSIIAASDGFEKGASFTIVLPQEVADSPSAGTRAVAAARKVAYRILVIEDNADAADALCAILELGGHQTGVAYDGPEGLHRARELVPDVVFCDIGLPGMNGYDVARSFRADPALRDATLVALSGYGTPDDVAKARAAGFDLHVTKPADRARLEQVLHNLDSAR